MSAILHLCKLLSIFVCLSIYEIPQNNPSIIICLDRLKTNSAIQKLDQIFYYLNKFVFVNEHKTIDNSEKLDSDLFEILIVYSCNFGADTNDHTLHM